MAAIDERESMSWQGYILVVVLGILVGLSSALVTDRLMFWTSNVLYTTTCSANSPDLPPSGLWKASLYVRGYEQIESPFEHAVCYKRERNKDAKNVLSKTLILVLFLAPLSYFVWQTHRD